MPGRSTFVRTTAVVAPAEVAPRCPDGQPHHWRVDAMWESPDDAQYERVHERCQRCGASKYVPRYFEPSWSGSIPRAVRRPRGPIEYRTEDDANGNWADSVKEVW